MFNGRMVLVQVLGSVAGLTLIKTTSVKRGREVLSTTPGIVSLSGTSLSPLFSARARTGQQTLSADDVEQVV